MCGRRCPPWRVSPTGPEPGRLTYSSKPKVSKAFGTVLVGSGELDILDSRLLGNAGDLAHKGAFFK